MANLDGTFVRGRLPDVGPLSQDTDWPEHEAEYNSNSSYEHFETKPDELYKFQPLVNASSKELFHRIFITGEEDLYRSDEMRGVLLCYLQAINMRRKYLGVKDINVLDELPSDSDQAAGMDSLHCYRVVDGITYVYESSELMASGAPPTYSPPVSTLADYYRDLDALVSICAYGPCKTHSYTRLRILESKFLLHKTLNEDREKSQQKAAPRRDFYNVYKVDTHVHLSSAMNQKHLLKFIKKKLCEEKHVTVLIRNGQLLSLQQVFDSLHLTMDDLSVDTLDVHSDNKTFHRFDRFNLKYNPVGESRLREVFLKADNYIKGRYLAELVRELIGALESSKYQCAEWRVSIYGRSTHEWGTLAAWVLDNNLISDQVRYLVQIPRLYDVYKKNGLVEDFADMLESIFEPLFAATCRPSEHPKLHAFLSVCTGLDCVDDESKADPRLAKKFPPPSEWNSAKNPAYSYYLFYIWANLKTLNMLRASKGMSTLAFRPHSGEAGEIEHLLSAFLLADGIAHGINLRRLPVLQYIFYLTQIPMAMSPLSNNSLFLDYSKNPFPVFYARGMNVTLSTDDPLQFHYTKEPLIEEYSVAAQVWKLTSCDICEIARLSVLQSFFPPSLKSKWIGPNYMLPGLMGNDIQATNVPATRIAFREETLMNELRLIYMALVDDNLLNLDFFRERLSQGSGSISQSQSAAQRLAEAKGECGYEWICRQSS